MGFYWRGTGFTGNLFGGGGGKSSAWSRITGKPDLALRSDLPDKVLNYESPYLQKQRGGGATYIVKFKSDGSIEGRHEGGKWAGRAGYAYS